ncbi:acyl-[acyl-carrier-protein]--UDP-N-acetylglucosamine O-acyltransferase, partial [Flavobacterium sp. LaA7.5]|nr:acyl-[acyl-carrier-protein]--UDP-N-acetylglucosamine O-acyltransferase [Flavobacterium salilacus subsp. altitudinum]
LNTVGLRRRGFSSVKIEEIKTIYRIIFQERRNTNVALDYIEQNFEPSFERNEILNFIRSSKRGIVKGVL